MQISEAESVVMDVLWQRHPLAAEDVVAEVRRREPRAVIALGRQGLQVASAMVKNSAVVAAGVLSVPEVGAPDFPVHSLAPDPSLLFNHLRVLAPELLGYGAAAAWPAGSATAQRWSSLQALNAAFHGA